MNQPIQTLPQHQRTPSNQSVNFIPAETNLSSPSQPPTNNTVQERGISDLEALPLNRNAPSCVIKMMEIKNGQPFSDIVEIFYCIADYLIDYIFIVKFLSTDSDISFDQLHNDFFDENIELLLNEGFETIVYSLFNMNKLLTSDPFHLLKGDWARLINHLVLIDISKLLRYVNI